MVTGHYAGINAKAYAELIVASTRLAVEMEDLFVLADKTYPKLARMLGDERAQDHHVLHKYLGGPLNGLLATLPASYHQMITSATLIIHPWRKGKPEEAIAIEIMMQVLEKLPLPIDRLFVP
ncbi:MAG: hypothetical protein LH471_05115 [Salinibacterium sp.]|nr:hypothetical protein [Salinibacterium sp.]